MILDCPNCHSRFLVADNLIPASGRTVRCGSCAHSWFVENPRGPETLEPTGNDFRKLLEQETPSDEFAMPDFGDAKFNAPAVVKKKWPVKPFKVAVPALAAVWFILAFIAYFPSWQNGPLSFLYHAVGAKPSSGISFAEVKMERETVKEGRSRFLLTGKIVNHNDSARVVPLARVTLHDKDGNSLWQRNYPVNVTLKAGEEYPFHIADIETSFADSVKTITLDLGSSFEMMMR